ncbi:hypothetical protein L226DRAFT_518066 [Lentinus tigrinus ALCF2SS1-7]|uniref:uncharacterized protein n=1 Tax=Lentinus tigrinus ALCF2SS1-7 TaxID=1328758 RepID=UPI001166204F|nr:hypothetical protein L226DRAFT_518066 [Lentinus tigrinus ALCF2SS1-7]
MSDASNGIAAAWHLLEITGIVQSVLCALFGVYILLFVVALWANHGRRTVSSRRLRIVTILLFVDLCAHFIARSLQFARARIMNPDPNEFFKWSIPLVVIGNVTTTFAGLCSDGLLAWRFYVIFDQQRWALYVPMTFVVINALLCWSADAQHIAAYTHYDFYENTLLEVTLKITVAWGWLMFAINTILTGAIIGKIFYIARLSGHLNVYETVLRASVESAFVTWIGLLLYEICSLAPNGHVVTNYDVGYVMACVLPVFFGISQCLIVVRVAIANELNQSRGSGTRVTGSSRTIAFAIPSFLHSDHDKVASDYVERSEEHTLAVLPRSRPSPSPEPSAQE